MSSLIGTVDHFVRGSSFAQYMERMDILYQLNNVADNMKKSLFITMSGPVIFEEVKLIYPGMNVKDIDYADMIEKLKNRFDKIEPNMMHRHRLHMRKQGVDEPAENYVLGIKLIAAQCGFGAHKDEAIKDAIIFGLRDQELKQKLLMKDEMTVDEVEQIVIRTELAKLRAKTLSGEEEARSINSVKYRLGNNNDEQRWNSGRNGRQQTRRFGNGNRSYSVDSNRSRSPGREHQMGRSHYRSQYRLDNSNYRSSYQQQQRRRRSSY